VEANGGENEETTTRLSRGVSVRDLYDTGTCQVCFRNVKIDKGTRILRHGWEVRYGVHSAACRGTEEFPFEVSCSITEGFLVPMLRHALAPLEEQRDAAQKALAALTDPRQIEAAEKEMLLLDVQIRDLRRYIAEVTRAVERWRPTPLPMTPGWRRIDFLSGK